MLKIRLDFIGKRAVVVVDIKDVVPVKVIGNIDILPPVMVDVAHGGGMTKALVGDPGLFAHIPEHRVL